MTERIACREAGFDCDFTIESENEAELVDFVRIHARSTHDKDISENEIREMFQ
ncbi:DUF1059 domain-containing protein [Halomicroarcula limicola]|uniref:DUF1059 domain-containing protein n=1 Tax=Haloarcula limicola TaxID=1429915 RepID=A0A8J7YB99_9EURY|nr:DUF1059 domain-containing protein [Halomicroarcula limicola]MBV0925278.1 DUF1059 domain-containing protein [Halomicroarcula limicola]